MNRCTTLTLIVLLFTATAHAEHVTNQTDDYTYDLYSSSAGQPAPGSHFTVSLSCYGQTTYSAATHGQASSYAQQRAMQIAAQIITTQEQGLVNSGLYILNRLPATMQFREIAAGSSGNAHWSTWGWAPVANRWDVQESGGGGY